MAKNINELTPAYAIHPGLQLADELEERGMTTKELGAKTGIVYTDWDGIIKGEIDMHPLYAAALQLALGIDAELWMALQKNYDADKLKIAEKNIKKATKVLFFPNGNVLVFDTEGQQIPELQKAWTELFFEFLESKGQDPTNIHFKAVLNDGQWKRLYPFKTEQGWNWRIE